MCSRELRSQPLGKAEEVEQGRMRNNKKRRRWLLRSNSELIRSIPTYGHLISHFDGISAVWSCTKHRFCTEYMTVVVIPLINMSEYCTPYGAWSNSSMVQSWRNLVNQRWLNAGGVWAHNDVSRTIQARFCKPHLIQVRIRSNELGIVQENTTP